jgi:hypothetical protein
MFVQPCLHNERTGSLMRRTLSAIAVTTADSARLTVLASSVGHDGASRVGTLKRIY